VPDKLAARLCKVVVAGALAVTCATVWAEPATFEYAARAGLAYSDNLGRTATNPLSSGSAVAGLQVSALRPTGRLTYSITSDLSYYDYFDKNFKSELLGQVQASSAYAILPESISWNSQLSYGQVRQNVQLAASPNNREGLVNFSTGPRFQARFGTLLEATFDAHFARANYTSGGLNNNTLGTNLVLGHRLAADTLLALGASYDDVTYDTRAGAPKFDYKRQEGFLRFDTKLVRTQISADAGYSKVTGGNQSSSSPLFRLRASHRLTPFVTAFVSFEQTYPTSQGTAPFNAGVVGGVADESILTAAPRLTQNTGAGVIYTRPRTSFELTFSRQQEKAKLGATGERSYDQTLARATRALTPRSNVSAFAGYTRETLGTSASSVNEASFGGQLSLSFGTALGIDVTVADLRRSSQQAFNTYSELSGGIYLRYGRVRQPFAAPTTFQNQP
jgi:hypothetical protein